MSKPHQREGGTKSLWAGLKEEQWGLAWSMCVSEYQMAEPGEMAMLRTARTAPQQAGLPRKDECERQVIVQETGYCGFAEVLMLPVEKRVPQRGRCQWQLQACSGALEHSGQTPGEARVRGGASHSLSPRTRALARTPRSCCGSWFGMRNFRGGQNSVQMVTLLW